MKPIPYSEVQSGAIFRVLRSTFLPKQDYRAAREVKNDGVYVKISDNHAVNLSNKKDCIFDLHIPCRVIDRSVDTSYLPDWHNHEKGKNANLGRTMGAQ